MVTFRNLKQINVEEFQSSLNFGNTEDIKDLELIYEKYVNELTRDLGQLAPEKTKLLTNRAKRPWVDQDLASQKKVLRRCEKIWLRFRTVACWQAYQHERRHHQGKIIEMQKEKISKKIEECGSNSRKLFQLVNHLTGPKPENPMPPRNTDKELADEFAHFFISKIVRIRLELDKHSLYQPSMSDVPEFNNFRKYNEDQASKLIMKTKSKPCELDPIPTTLLKRNLGMELLKSSYRPVSNLPYILKLVEKATMDR